ncbi:MAG TPA: DUF805 domain-containing protein, partial [Paracoccaceae bacterium]|nr:DUF805 domain-containing protein [Paracoccaceae bacterium]
MGFSEAIQTVLTRRYADFQGRSRRSEFWWFVLFYCLLMAAISFVIGSISESLGSTLTFLAWLGLLVPYLAVGVRRLHDIDRTGWWILIGFIPIIGAIVLIFFFVQRGTEGVNRFGPD